MTTTMPVLTLWQPWASLIVIGEKNIETRSWETSHRGPIAIHAAARQPRPSDLDHCIIGEFSLGSWCDDVEHVLDDDNECGCDDDENLDGACLVTNSDRLRPALLRDEGGHGFSLATYMPFGAIIATAVLVDVVPADSVRFRPARDLEPGLRYATGPACTIARNSEHAYGDYTPGRYAWLLADVRVFVEPIPFTGGQRLSRTADLDVPNVMWLAEDTTVTSSTAAGIAHHTATGHPVSGTDLYVDCNHPSCLFAIANGVVERPGLITITDNPQELIARA